MSDDVRMAFAHPSERAEASATQPCDRISLSDYVVEVEIGAFDQERGHLQRVRFNVVVEVAPNTGEVSDDVDEILSYDRVTEAIDGALAVERLNLLETLAARVAETILLEPLALRVFVRIEKLDRGPFSLGVEIVRSKNEGAASAIAQKMPPKPLVIYLSNAAIETGRLSKWLDAAVVGKAPLVLCVGRPDLPRLGAQTNSAQNRIDLLSIDQNAVRLASLDERLSAVSTRTELDWSMKNGQLVVWAPSKLVQDAVETPEVGAEAPEKLALWFASEMSAQKTIFVGTDVEGADAYLEPNVDSLL